MCGCDFHRFAVVFSTFMICFLTVGAAYGNSSVYYNFWLDYFQSEKSLTSAVGSCNIGLILITGPVASVLANRYGHRIVVMVGGLVSSAAMVAASFSPSIPVLLVTHIICALGWMLVFVPGSMAVSFYWREKYLGVIFGITISGIGVGQFAAPLLVETLTELYSWRGALLIQAGLNFNLIACGAMLFPAKGMRKKSNYFEFNLLKDWIFTNSLIYWIFCHMGISVAGVNIAYVVKAALGADYRQSAIVAAVFGISGAVARLGHSFITKLPRVHTLLQQLVAVVLMAVCLISMPHVTSYPLMVGITILTGVGMGSMSLNNVLVIDIVGLKSRTAGYGFFATSAGLGLASGAPLAGLLSDLTGGRYDISLYFGGGIQLFSVLIQLGPLIKWSHVKTRQAEQIPVEEKDSWIEESNRLHMDGDVIDANDT